MPVRLWRRAAGAGLVLTTMLALGTGPAGAATPARVLDSSTGQAVTQRPGDVATAAPRAGNSARVPAGLQAAIDKTLAREPVTSSAGLTLGWGQHGTVWFLVTKGPWARFGLRPVSVGRSSSEALSPGTFVFGPKGTTESLGDGLSVWYRTSASGFEQGFSVSRRPAGAAQSFNIVLASSGGLHAAATGPDELAISGPRGPVMTYGALRATDATGRARPARLAVGPGQVRIVVDDAGATYPVTIDPYVAPSSTPAATFTGSLGEELGLSVALSADGQTALVGAPSAGSGNGAAYLYSETGGVWPTTPSVTFTGSSAESLGSSVALSADAQTALVGAPDAGANDNGAAYLYSEAGGTWPATPSATFTGNSDEILGWSVALSADGQTALLGAPGAGSGYNGDAYL